MDSRINVVVRCRPLNESEQRGRRALTILEDGVQVADKKFNFELVLDEDTRQVDVYESCVRTLVEGCFEGFNATVLACECAPTNRLISNQSPLQMDKRAVARPTA